MKNLNLLIIFLTFSFLSIDLPANNIDLSLNRWSLWLDKESSIKPDASGPSCGWRNLSDKGIEISLPATVEEHLWGEGGAGRYGLSGDYVGVSWFSTELDIPLSARDKRILLGFESVRLCAEIFVNEEFVGRDELFGTPFSFDITEFLRVGEKNKLSVKIIDPDGNFTWTDFNPHFWGTRRITPCHGFGGITGKVKLEFVDENYISDVFIKNTPDITAIEAEVTIENLLKKRVPDGQLCFSLVSTKDSAKVLYERRVSVSSEDLKSPYSIGIKYPDAKPWSTDEPNLYFLNVSWRGEDGSSHSLTKRFGFRWFAVKDGDGGRYFELNGKRIVLRTSISWGFWPVNGIYPTPELAEKQIRLAKELGLNMLNFHRGIGQTLVLDKADELGLLYYEEPGGYKTGGNTKDESLQKMNRDRFVRMIKRDRSHPSLIIYNMINEISNRQPLPFEIEDLKLFHEIDETRHITYTSSNFFKVLHGGKCPVTPSPVKSHMLPYDTVVYQQGWWDQHFPDGPGVYCDRFYKGPGDGIFRNSSNLDEIVMWGEDGAIGTPPRLQLIKEEIERNGNILGWDGDCYLAQYEAFNSFLKNNKAFGKAFPDVDSFTKSFGNVAMYYQGRIIENIRIGNVVDCYVVNGWEETKIENHSGIVDAYRNPKGNTELISLYNRPLYVSVKLRNKVVSLGRSVIADFYIVNEKDLRGKFNLKVVCKDSEGEFFLKEFKVNINGGNEYGQLLMENVQIVPRNEGYTEVYAFLEKNNKNITTGFDSIYCVEETLCNNEVCLIDDSLSKTSRALDVAGVKYVKITPNDAYKTKASTIVMGSYSKEFSMPGIEARNSLIEWVKNGGKMVVLEDADMFASFLAEKEVLDYRGSIPLRTVWFGGNYAVADNEFFDGLPVNTAFNWEYQSLAQYHKNRKALRINNGECLVAAIAEHRPEVFTALHRIRLGKGEIILSTLDIVLALNRQDEPANVVARQLLVNLLKLSND